MATLKPIRTHINRKTGRLLGTQATTITAGMKNWEGKNRRLKQAPLGGGGGGGGNQQPYREPQENCGLLPDSQQNHLPQRDRYRGCNLGWGALNKPSI